MKFKEILLCTDLDGTLLRDDKSVSKENFDAIEYFKDNGGIFTFITGRTPLAIGHILETVKPNAPIGCLNGGSIYDPEEKKNLFEMELSKGVVQILDSVAENFASVGIEVITHEHVYFCKQNYRTREHRMLERLPEITGDYHTVPGKWAKILLIDEEPVIDKLIPFLAELECQEEFDFVRSTPYYYEILPPGASKGNLLMRLAELTGAHINKTIAVGDNENDISMIKAAKIGYAVENATPEAKEAADIVTVSNMDHALAKIIDDLDKSITKF